MARKAKKAWELGPTARSSGDGSVFFQVVHRFFPGTLVFLTVRPDQVPSKQVGRAGRGRAMFNFGRADGACVGNRSFTGFRASGKKAGNDQRRGEANGPLGA